MLKTSNYKSRILIISRLLMLLFFIGSATGSFAMTMESSSYIMSDGSIGGSGSVESASSASYMLYSNVGQVSPAGTSESSNYSVCSGIMYTLFDEVYGYDYSIDGSSASSVTSLASERPVISGNILDECLIPGSTSVEVSVDGKKYFVNLVKTGPRKYHFSFSPDTELSGVTHEVVIRATNLAGSADIHVFKLLKQSELFSASSKPKNVPNPFRPRHGEGTTIMYNLASASGAKMIIYDITGKAIWQKSFGPGAEGGKTGLNSVFWDGKNDFGEYVGNGAYIYIVTSGSKILHKGQMAVMD
jgi:hypothetical protein